MKLDGKFQLPATGKSDYCGLATFAPPEQYKYLTLCIPLEMVLNE
jgi:hypothetical protein